MRSCGACWGGGGGGDHNHLRLLQGQIRLLKKHPSKTLSTKILEKKLTFYGLLVCVHTTYLTGCLQHIVRANACFNLWVCSQSLHYKYNFCGCNSCIFVCLNVCVRVCLCECMAPLQSCVPSATSAGGATQGWCCWCIITPCSITCPTLLPHNTLTNEPTGYSFSFESLRVSVCLCVNVHVYEWVQEAVCLKGSSVVTSLLFSVHTNHVSWPLQCCFIGSVLPSNICLCLHQTEQLEVLLANVPFYLQNYVCANPLQGVIIYNGWLLCRYHLVLSAQVPHLTWRSMVDSVCVLSVKTVALLAWLCPMKRLAAYLTTWPFGGC